MAEHLINLIINKPYRAKAAEEAIAGKPINKTNAEAAGEAAVSGAVVLEANRYKVQIAKGDGEKGNLGLSGILSEGIS